MFSTFVASPTQRSQSTLLTLVTEAGQSTFETGVIPVLQMGKTVAEGGSVTCPIPHSGWQGWVIGSKSSDAQPVLSPPDHAPTHKTCKM